MAKSPEFGTLRVRAKLEIAGLDGRNPRCGLSLDYGVQTGLVDNFRLTSSPIFASSDVPIVKAAALKRFPKPHVPWRSTWLRPKIRVTFLSRNVVNLQPQGWIDAGFRLPSTMRKRQALDLS